MMKLWRSGVVGMCMLGSVVAIGADLTPYAYVELSKRVMAQKLVELEQKLSSISSFEGSGDSWLTMEAQLTGQFDASYASLYGDFGVEENRYLQFYSAHQGDVDGYLEAHPEDAASLNDMAAQANTLLEAFESRKAALLGLSEAAPPVPPEL